MDARTTGRAPSDGGTRGVGVRAEDIVFGGLLGLFAYLGTAAALVAVLAPEPPDASWQELLADRPAVLVPRDDRPEDAPDVFDPQEEPALVELAEPEPTPVAAPPSPPDEAGDTRRQLALHSTSITAGLSRRLRERRQEGLEQDLLLLKQGAIRPSGAGELGTATRGGQVGPDDLGPGGDPSALGPLVASSGPAPASPEVRAPERVAEAPVTPDVQLRSDGLPRRLQVRFRTCYEQALRARPGLSGRLSLTVEVEEERVIDVVLLDDTVGVEEVRSCVLGAARRWRALERADGVLGPWSVVFRPR